MKIDNLTPHVGALDGSEPLPTVKAGSKKITTAQIAALGQVVGMEGAAVLATIYAALADETGSDLVGFQQSGIDSAVRTMQDKARERLSTADKTGNFGAKVTAQLADMANGGILDAEKSSQLVVTSTVTFNRLCFTLQGQGRVASIINPNFGGVVFDINAGIASTAYQNKIKDFGWYSTEPSNKTLIRIYNGANVEVSNNTVAQGSILGSGSIGVLIEGRELCWLHDNIWAIARPIVIRRNTAAGAQSITTDYLVIEREHLICTDLTRACIEVENDTYLSNTVIRDTALVMGRHGVYMRNTTFAAVSYCLSIINTRREQVDPSNAAYFAYDLDFEGASTRLQNFVFAQNLLSNSQQGFKGRGIIRSLFYSVTLPQTGGKVALDYDIPNTGSLTLMECTGGVGGVKTITNNHPVIVVPSRAAGDPIGSFEHHVRWVTPADPGPGGLYNFDSLPSLSFGGIETACFELTVPAGSRNIRLPLIPAVTGANPDAVGAEVFVRSKDGRMHLFYPADGGLPTTIAATGIFAAVATANKIYGDGSSANLIANSLAVAQTIHVEVRK